MFAVTILMTAVEASGPRGPESLATGASYAPLLAESDEAAAARWQTLGDYELDAEVAAYRAALRAATAEFEGTGAAQPCGRPSGEPFTLIVECSAAHGICSVRTVQALQQPSQQPAHLPGRTMLHTPAA